MAYRLDSERESYTSSEKWKEAREAEIFQTSLLILCIYLNLMGIILPPPRT